MTLSAPVCLVIKATDAKTKVLYARIQIVMITGAYRVVIFIENAQINALLKWRRRKTMALLPGRSLRTARRWHWNVPTVPPRSTLREHVKFLPMELSVGYHPIPPHAAKGSVKLKNK